MTWWAAFIIGYLMFSLGVVLGGLLGNSKYEERMAELEKQLRDLDDTVKWRGEK